MSRMRAEPADVGNAGAWTTPRTPWRPVRRRTRCVRPIHPASTRPWQSRAAPAPRRGPGRPDRVGAHWIGVAPERPGALPTTHPPRISSGPPRLFPNATRFSTCSTPPGAADLRLARARPRVDPEACAPWWHRARSGRRRRSDQQTEVPRGAARQRHPCRRRRRAGPPCRRQCRRCRGARRPGPRPVGGAAKAKRQAPRSRGRGLRWVVA